MKYHNIFLNSTIYCFEPTPESFNQLKQFIQPYENITAFKFGLSDIQGKSIFHSNIYSPTNSILATHNESDKVWGDNLLNTLETVEIELTTLDDFIENHRIERIDILKLDVQGAEYKVINGAKEALKKGLIKLIYMEIITLPTYVGQKYFDEILFLLRNYGFELFNFYNYSLTNSGQLRQIDAIFVKSKNSGNTAKQ